VGAKNREMAFLDQREELQDCYQRLLEQEEEIGLLRRCLDQPDDLVTKLRASEARSRALEQEVQLLRRVIWVMREDLNVKAEQFTELYASLKSANDEREAEHAFLRARLMALEKKLRKKLDEHDTHAPLAHARGDVAPHESSVDRLSVLPVELSSRILAFLDGPSLAGLGSTCRYWRLCTSSDALWHHLYAVTFNAKSRIHLPRRPSKTSELANPALLLPLSLQNVAGRIQDSATEASSEQAEESKSNKPAARSAVNWRERFQNRYAVDSAWTTTGSRRTRKTALVGHKGTVTSLALRGSQLLSGSDDGSLILWSLEPPAGYQSAVNEPPPPALGLASLFSPMPIATTEHDIGRTHLEDLRRHLHSTLPRVPGLQGGTDLGSARSSSQKRVHFGAPDEFRPFKSRVFHGHGGPVWCIAFDDAAEVEGIHQDLDALPDPEETEIPLGQLFVSGSYDRTLKIWDLGGCRRTLRGHTDWVSCLSMRQRIIVSGGYDATIRIWNAASGQNLRNLDAGDGNGLYCMSWFRGNGVSSKVTTGCHLRHAQVWDIEAGEITAQLRGHEKMVYAIQSIEDKGVITGSADHTVKLWDLNSAGGACLTLRGHTQPVMAVASQDWRVVSGSYDETIQLWDLRSPETPVRTFRDHAGAVFCLATDERRMVSGSVDRTIRINAFGPAPSGGIWSPMRAVT